MQIFPLWHLSPSSDPDVYLTGDLLAADRIPPLQVSWTADETSYDTSVIRIRNKRHVVIEDVAIKQVGHALGTDLSSLRTGKHSIFVEGCESLVIRNVYLAGPAAHSHLRVRGCRYVFIENVEIEGIPVADLLEADELGEGSEGLVAAAGIWIENGSDAGTDCSLIPGVDDGEGGDPAQNEENVEERPIYVNDSFCEDSSADCYANDLEWVVIQNSHIHGYTWNPSPDPARGIFENNHDGIAVESPADGIIFNTVVEDWWGGDALIDAGHRRGCDEEYRDHRFRVERNVLKGVPDQSSAVKTVGRGEPSNAILMANNFYKDLHIVDYHSDFPVYHVNESFFASEDAERKVWYKMKDFGPTFAENQFVRTPEGDVAMKIITSDVLPPDPATWEEEGFLFSATSNFYALPESTIVARVEEEFLDDEGEEYSVFTHTNNFVAEWQGAAGQNENSVLTSDCLVLSPDSGLCGAEDLKTVDWIRVADPALLVERDFFGAIRSGRPTPGALEASSWRRIHRPFAGIRSDVAVGLRLGGLIGRLGSRGSRSPGESHSSLCRPTSGRLSDDDRAVTNTKLAGWAPINEPAIIARCLLAGPSFDSCSPWGRPSPRPTSIGPPSSRPSARGTPSPWPGCGVS